MERKIYCYHKEHENELRIKAEELPIFKIGDTALQTVEERIKQQDNSSNSEPLIKLWEVDVPDNFLPEIQHVDKLFHNWLETKHGILKYREDADREWFEFTNSCEAKRYLNEFLYNKHVLNTYEMRLCQQEACNRMVSYYTNGGNNFLLAAKMRYGKNFTILNFIKTIKYKNVLFLSYKNVFEPLEHDINDHVLFADEFKYIAYKKERVNITNCIDPNKVNIVVCSAQMLGYAYKDNMTIDDINACTKLFKKNLKNLSNIEWDIIITDECHYGADTANFNELCNELNCDRKLYISGTPFKTLHSYTDDALYMYTYLDEQNDPNNTMPKMYQYGLRLDSNLISKYNKYIETTDYPTMQKAFQSEDGINFKYPEVACNILDHVLNKGIKSQNMEEINHMFIYMDNVNACKAATNYINNSIIYNTTFFAINAAGQGKDVVTNEADLKKGIIRGINKGKKTITFSCGRFVEGATIPEWNAVIMLNDSTSAITYFQAIFRAQSPDKEGKKKKFYVIDYKPDRLLTVNYEFIKNLPIKNKTQNKKSIEWLKATEIVITDPTSDQELRAVSYEDIEKTFFAKGLSNNNMVNSPYMYNTSRDVVIDTDNIRTLAKALNISGTFSISGKTNTNDVAGGKTIKIKNQQKHSNSSKEKAYKIEDLINAFKRIMGKVTKFIVAHKDCKDFYAFINCIKQNKDEFSDTIKDSIIIEKSKRHNIDADLFLNIIEEFNFINIDGFNAVCNEFWRHYDIVINSTIEDKRNFRTKWELNDISALIDNTITKPLMDIIDFNDINLCYKTILQLNAVDTYMLEVIANKLFNSISYINKYNNENDRLNAIYSNIYVVCSSIAHYNYVKTFMPDINIIIKENLLVCDKQNIDLYNNMKFDYIIQNPPYSIRSKEKTDYEAHLVFAKMGYDLLTDTGKMVIIEPATWLLNINRNKKAKELISLYGNHIYKVIIDNFNKAFNINTRLNLSITYIDKAVEYANITYTAFGITENISHIFDANIIGKHEVIMSILNKVQSYNDMMKSHVTNIPVNGASYFPYKENMTLHG